MISKEILKYISNTDKEILDVYESLDIKYKGANITVYVGDIFERLEVKALLRFRDPKEVRKGCICKCSCGNVIGPKRLVMLLRGELLSCGCYSRDLHSKMLKEKNTIHGQNVRGHRTQLYNTWAGMLDRCNNINRNDSKYYSLKGIQVCDEWKSFEVFKDWALTNGYKEGLSIERKDNSLGYNPENCIFIQLSDQNKNKSNSRILTCNGISRSITDWCEITGLSWSTIDRRLKRGLSTEEALNANK